MAVSRGVWGWGGGRKGGGAGRPCSTNHHRSRPAFCHIQLPSASCSDAPRYLPSTIGCPRPPSAPPPPPHTHHRDHHRCNRQCPQGSISGQPPPARPPAIHRLILRAQPPPPPPFRPPPLASGAHVTCAPASSPQPPALRSASSRLARLRATCAMAIARGRTYIQPSSAAAASVSDR